MQRDYLSGMTHDLLILRRLFFRAYVRICIFAAKFALIIINCK